MFVLLTGVTREAWSSSLRSTFPASFPSSLSRLRSGIKRGEELRLYCSQCTAGCDSDHMAPSSSSAPLPETNPAVDESTYPTAPQPPAYLPLVKLFALDRLDAGTESPSGHKYERFRAKYAPLRPREFRVAYGGYVFGHSAYAAAKTVDKGMLIHNITGSFTAPGTGSIPFTFYVRHVREGQTYCLRAVDVRQKEEICFSCLVSFKRVESSYNFCFQPPMDIDGRYKVALHGIKRENQPLAPSLDTPQWTEEVEKGLRPAVPFSGTDIRKVKMKRYNEMVGAKEDPTRYRQVHFYRLFGLPGDDEEGSGYGRDDIAALRARDEAGEFDNLHICAHLFASDRNSLWLIAWALNRAQRVRRIASLSHTVVIHTHGPAMRMIDWDRLDVHAGADGTADLGEGRGRKWFTIEARTTRAGENRALHQGQIWGPDGTLVATTVQDGLLRVWDDGVKL
uniref:Acyl-CoA thioesterase II n=1 Tax=Coccidioides posadasii RMSCC 3488 TaxID=454284 RepID=A0A0J6FEU7_COCPO|nr:hypothetical protein CPAG_07964 [Coccidioides posadasii RMSCC 3488]